MLEIQEYVDISNYSTFKIGGQFRYFAEISSINDINHIYTLAMKESRFKNIPTFILGGGSNTIFSGGILNIIALKINMLGFEIVSEGQNYMEIKVGAGEIWDEIVSRTVTMGLSGFESLSAIPGTVGATPIQNVGAYGTEVKDTIKEVEVFDTKDNTIKLISNTDCKFGYRDSIFKNEAKGRYIVTAVIYRLGKITSPKILFARSSDEGGQGARPSQKVLQAMFSPALSYPGIKKYFEEKKIENPTLKQMRDAIIEIRREKLPNPKEIPNVGSFFKNPIVINDIADEIKLDYPNVKFFEVDHTHMKVPAGWLIENAGLKGKSFGNISVYDKNALVLVNNGKAIAKDIVDARNEIIKTVYDKFGIILEQEPEII